MIKALIAGAMTTIVLFNHELGFWLIAILVLWAVYMNWVDKEKRRRRRDI